MPFQSEIIKQEARKCGFDLCGIAPTKLLKLEKERFEKALARNYHAKKTYLERDINKRFDPESLLKNCKSVIVCGFNYNMQKPETIDKPLLVKKKLSPIKEYKISQFAQIIDYHIFIKEKLEDMACGLQEKFGFFHYKTTVDSSSISEKAWAVEVGLGYYGKNGIIQTALGSFVFLGILLIDKEVDTYNEANQNSCGDCCKCLTACPTKAIVAPYYVDCNQCIASINVLKKANSFTQIAKYGWIIGCDECQNVCPNNLYAPINKEAVAMRLSFMENKNKIFYSLTAVSFDNYFKNTVIYPLKYEGLKVRLNDFITANQD